MGCNGLNWVSLVLLMTQCNPITKEEYIATCEALIKLEMSQEVPSLDYILNLKDEIKNCKERT